MAKTIMTASVVKLDNTAGTLEDVSAQCKTAQVQISITSAEYRTFADGGWPRQTTGKLPRGATVNITAVRTDTDDELANIIDEWVQSASVDLKSIELYDPDTATGSRKISGEVMLKNPGDWMNKDASSGNEQTLSIQLAFDGQPTFETVAGS